MSMLHQQNNTQSIHSSPIVGYFRLVGEVKQPRRVEYHFDSVMQNKQ